MNLASFLHCLIDGEIEHARHRANFLADTFPGANEHGINESFGSKAGLANQIAELLGSAKPAKTGDRKSHKAPEFLSVTTLQIRCRVNSRRHFHDSSRMSLQGVAGRGTLSSRHEYAAHAGPGSG